MIRESDITKSLIAKHRHNSVYAMPNMYIYRYDWESDFFVLKQSGYSYEFEIKVSRSDFHADKNKVLKHRILEHGEFDTWKEKWENGQLKRETIRHEWKCRPNKFYYVTPERMVSVNEVPKYAGLIYFNPDKLGNNRLKEVKKAPIIHKDKLDFYKKLCSRFYHYYLRELRENFDLKQRIKELKNQ